MDYLKETMRDVLENNILSYWLTKVKVFVVSSA